MNFKQLPSGDVPAFSAVSDTVYLCDQVKGSNLLGIKLGKGIKNVYVSGLKGSGGYGLTTSTDQMIDDNGGGSTNINIFGIIADGKGADKYLMRKSGDRATWDGTVGSSLYDNLRISHAKLIGGMNLYYGTWNYGKDYLTQCTFDDIYWGDNPGRSPICIQSKNCFGIKYSNWKFNSTANPLGDCGMIWHENSSPEFTNMQGFLSWGYIARIGEAQLPGVTFDQTVRATNCLKARSTHYALFSYRTGDFSDPSSPDYRKIFTMGFTAKGFSMNNCTHADAQGGGYYAGGLVIGDSRDQNGAPLPVVINKCYVANVFTENQWKLGLIEDDSSGNAKVAIDAVSVPKTVPAGVAQAPYTYQTGYKQGNIPAADKIDPNTYFPLPGSPLLTSGIGARPYATPALPVVPDVPVVPVKLVKNFVVTTTVARVINYTDGTSKTGTPSVVSVTDVP